MDRRPIVDGIGLMCGTSHDGLDVAHVRFNQTNKTEGFEILNGAETSLPENLKLRLDHATKATALELVELDRDFARFSADTTNYYLKKWGAKPAFIASHGVTIFHDPLRGITTQVGSGAVISAMTGIITVSDFRTQDVAKGGNGAPLVSFADSILFPDYDCTLNLGGFANVTALKGKHTTGWDIAPCNLLLNHLAGMAGKSYDKGGAMANRGKLIPDFLHVLNALPFYKKQPPKSLGYEWFEAHVLPLIPKTNNQEKMDDLLHTACEHIAMQVGKVLAGKKCLVTGGGAFNAHLVKRISFHGNCVMDVPSADTVRYKEALCFAFLGLMRLRGATNVLSRVTGASADTCAGAVYIS